MPCPPRGTVLVHQVWLRSSSLSPHRSLSVKSCDCISYVARIFSKLCPIGDNAGDLSGLDYSDSTPDVTYTFDRLGRQKTIVQGSSTTMFTYNDASQLLTESYSGGTLNGLSVTNGYDQYLRRTNLTALNGSTVLARSTYGYDSASRLKTVADGVNKAAYSYLANSPLVGNVWFTNNTTLRMTTTKSYDYLNRLTVTDFFGVVLLADLAS